MKRINYIIIILSAAILSSCSDNLHDKSSHDTNSSDSLSFVQSSSLDSTEENGEQEWQTVNNCLFNDNSFTCDLGTFNAENTVYTEPVTLETMTPYIVNNIFEIPVQVKVIIQDDELIKCSAINSAGEEVNEDGFYPVSCFKNILKVTKDGELYQVDMSAVSEYKMNDFCADTSKELSITAFKFNNENKMVARTVDVLTETSQWYDESTGGYIGEGKSYEAGYTDFPYFACEIKDIDGEWLIVKTNISDKEISLKPVYYIGNRDFSEFKIGDKIIAKFTDSELPELTEYPWSVIKPISDVKAKITNVRNFSGLEVRAQTDKAFIRIFPESIVDNKDKAIDPENINDDYTTVNINFKDMYTIKNCSDSDGQYTKYYVKKCVLE